MTVSQHISNVTSVAKSPQIRSAHLDGIRGFAALYVAAFHCYQMQLFVSPEIEPPRVLLFKIVKPLCMGHYAVAVFIVLSGYCLMLPIARVGGAYALRDGWGGYLRRRARRILPSFYAAVLLTLALFPVTRAEWDAIAANGRTDVQSIIRGTENSALISQFLSHLVLCNNGVPVSNEPQVKFENNTPMWSVATESQIYFLFPALLLPILRRFGPWSAVSAGIAVGAALSFAFGGRYQLACPWMLGVFGIGMFGALISCSPEDIYGRLRKEVPWGVLGVSIVICFLVIGTVKLGLFRRNPVIVDTILGIGIMSCLVAMSRISDGRGSNYWRRCVDILSSRIARLLGGCSYSLYLIHYPLLVLFQAYLLRKFSSLIVLDIVMLVPVMGAIVGLAYAFSLLFERPFMRTAGRNR